MVPYYEKDGVTIYHGDRRLILPQLPSVDLLCTDPPYGIGEAAGKNKSRSCLGTSKDYGDSAWDDQPAPRWLIDQAVEKARYAIVFGGNYYGFPASTCWLVWDKDNGENDFADCELAWTNLKKAVRRTRYRWQGMLQEHMGSKKEPRFHPTQKPLAVMTWAISHAPDDCQTILDPFMGSGTTLRAAKDLGRKAIGIIPRDAYWHGYRHAYATGLVAAGAPIKLVSQALGHSSVQVTEKVYSHLDDEIEAMQDAFREARKRKRA